MKKIWMLPLLVMALLIVACSEPEPEWREAEEPIFGTVMSIFKSGGSQYAEVKIKTGKVFQLTIKEGNVKAIIKTRKGVEKGDRVAIVVRELRQREYGGGMKILKTEYQITDVAVDKH